MGPKLEAVLAEPWRYDGGLCVVAEPYGHVRGSFQVQAAGQAPYAAVAALGTSALALMLKVTSAFDPETGEGWSCPCCEANAQHEPGCEWAEIIEEARRLG